MNRKACAIWWTTLTLLASFAAGAAWGQALAGLLR